MTNIYLRHPTAQRLALIIGITVFIILTFNVSFSSMWDLWQTSDHRHGILVFPISAFLIWRQRHIVADLELSIGVRGLLVIFLLAAGWIVARLAGIQVIEHALVLAMIPATIATLTGAKFTNKLLFPLLFLLLATPLGDSLVPGLMLITADISTGLLKLSGIPLFRDGQYVSLPGGEFVVADVCAGLRYLVAGVMISLLYGYLTYQRLSKRVILVLVTAVLLIVANGLRAYIVMAVASVSEMRYLGGRDHIYFGWLLFGIVMMLIMWFGTRFADDPDEPGSGPSDATAIRASHSALPLIGALGLVMLAITVKPLQADFGETGAMLAAVAALLAFVVIMVRRSPSIVGRQRSAAGTVRLHFGWKPPVVVLLTLSVLILTPRFAVGIERNAVNTISSIDLRATVPCMPSGPWKESWEPRFAQPDFKVAESFVCSGREVSVYVAAYASALQGRELISSSHWIVPPAWDRITDTTTVSLTDSDGPEKVTEIQVLSDSYNALVWYWYEVDQWNAASPTMAKAQQLLALVRGRPAGGRVIVVKTTLNDDIDAARNRIRGIAEELAGKGPVDSEKVDR